MTQYDFVDGISKNSFLSLVLETVYGVLWNSPFMDKFSTF